MRWLSADSNLVAECVKAGGHILVVGLDEKEAETFLPAKVGTRAGEHIAAFFEPLGQRSLFGGLSPAEVHNRDPRNMPLITSGAVPLGNGVLGQAPDSNIVFCQLVPWSLGGDHNNQRRTFRRLSFLVSRLLSNMGASASTPLLERFHRPVLKDETRWLDGFYLDKPQEWDDPYRFFRW